MDTTPKKQSTRPGSPCSLRSDEGARPACPAEDPRPISVWQPEGEEIVAALRAFFLTHTLDPLTGEVYTVH